MKNSFKGYDAGMEREILAQTAYHHEDQDALTSQAQNEYARRDRNMVDGGPMNSEQNPGFNPLEQPGGSSPNPNQGGGGGDGGGQRPPGAPGTPDNPPPNNPNNGDSRIIKDPLALLENSFSPGSEGANIVQQLKEASKAFQDNPVNLYQMLDGYKNGVIQNAASPGSNLSTEDAAKIMKTIDAWKKKIEAEVQGQRGGRNTEGGRPRGVNLYITDEDAAQLNADPEGWLNSKLDIIYQDSRSTPSALIGVVQNQMAYIDTAIDNLDLAIRIREEFKNRIGLLGMRLQIEGKNMEQVKGAAQQLLTRGLLSPMGYEQGKVGALFARMQDKLDDKRLADGGSEKHVRPEFVAQFQEDLIEEQLQLAKNGAGLWAAKGEESFNEEKARKDITRAVRTAYDAFVSSTRQALIVSRGRHLSGADAFFSDPIGAFANVYNIEDLATGKFGIFNADQVEFLEEIKLELARDNLAARGLDPKSLDREEMLDLGTSLFKDMYAVPDFFSSGWRMKGIVGQIGELAKKKYGDAGAEKAKDFALFIRLRQAALTSPPTNPQREVDMEAAWQKIRDFRAEEIIRLYRDRSPEDLHGLAQQFRDKGLSSFEDKTITDDKSAYDVFKAKYGAIMRSMRDEKMKVVDDKGNILDFRQLNFGNLSSEDKTYVIEQVNKAFPQEPEAGKNFLLLYKTMQDYVDSHSLIYGLIGKSKDSIQHARESLAAVNAQFANFPDNPEGREAKRKAMNNWQKQYAKGYEEFVKTNPRERATRKKSNEFDGIYTRVLMVDDALLSALEVPPEGSDLTPLSKIYSTDFGGDALVRNMNDTFNADKAGQALRDFIIAEKPEEKAKKAEEFSGSVAAYNGTLPKAQTLRFTLGTYEQLAVSPLFMDVLGFRKLPFRIPTTRLEEIFGPQAMPKSTDERRIVLDHLKSAITANMAELTEDQKHLPIEEQERIIEENKAVAQRWYFDLEKKLKVKKGDIVQLKLLQVLLFFLLATGGEAIKMPTDIFQQVASGK